MIARVCLMWKQMSFELRARWVEVTVMMFVLNTGFELQSIIAREYEGVDWY